MEAFEKKQENAMSTSNTLYQDRGRYQEPSYNQEHNSYNQKHNSYNPGPSSYNQQDRNSYDQNYYSHNTRGRDPYTEQTIQSYPPQEKFYSDPYNGYGEVVNNEILGEFLQFFIIHPY